jgi:hypothetical protein
VRDPQLIGESFTPEQTAAAYIQLFEEIRDGRFTRHTIEPTVYQTLRAMRDKFL